MDTATFTAQSVIGMQPEVVFAKINAEVDTVTAKHYGVSGYPTIILTDAKGIEVDRILGYLPPAEFIKTIDDYGKGIGTLDDLQGQLSRSPNDAELIFRVGDKFVGRSRWDEARAQFDRVVTVDPTNERGHSDDAMHAHARTLYKQKRWDDAIAGFRRMVKHYPESELVEDAETYVPYIHAKAGNNTKALDLYRKFLEKYPDSEEVEWVRKQIDKIENPPKEGES